MDRLLQGIKSPCTSNLDSTSSQLFLTLINVLVASQCPLGSKDPYPEDYGPKLVNNQEFDFIVVGGGSSGSVVANRLTENPDWSTLVLEVGGFPSATSEIPGLLFNLQGTEEDWQYKTEKSEHSCKAYKDERCRWPRGKVLGGSSTINAMIYNRGNSRDYDEWEKDGNPGWSYENLKPTFHNIERLRTIKESDFYGQEGHLDLSWYHNKEPISSSLAMGIKEFGYPTYLEQNPEDPMGYYQTLMSIDKGIRTNVAKAFLGQVKERKNLHVATKAYVRKILINKSTWTVYGVEVQVGRNILNITAKKEIILSAGSLNTPQILMHSGVGPKTHLQEVGIEVLKNLPGVGQNLQDHVIVPLFFKIQEEAYNPRQPGHLLDDLFSYFLYKTGPLATIHVTNLIGFVNTKNDSKYPNIQLQHVGHHINDKLLLPRAYGSFGLKDDLLAELSGINTISSLFNVMPVLLNPKSRGAVRLKSKNVYEGPTLHSGYFSDENGEDMESMIKAIRFVQNLFKTKPLQQYKPEYAKLTLPTCDVLLYDSDEYWRCFIKHFATTIYHQVGTAKMGSVSDNMAVVDGRLKVHGFKNLRVIDGSIMPKITSGNTNAPCLVIGYKGGDMILEDWREHSEEHEEL